jgi:GDSL-like lipase/acylhydrolase family protein
VNANRLISRRATWLLCVAALVVPGCGGSDHKDGRASAPAPKSTPGYPNSIAVLGHSGATGEGSDPHRPGAEVRANSWATGSNPAVKSLYMRILAKNPAIKGHSFNAAEAGATVDKLVPQARRALSQNPKPELFVVQIMDNDIVCPKSEHDLTAFRSTFVKALKALAKGAPQSSIFVVSQFGSPDTYAKSLTRVERQTFGGSEQCDFVDPSGGIVPKKVGLADELVHSYEAQLKTGCRRVQRCRYDGGALGDIVDRREYYSSDLNHLTVMGHAKAAAAAWAAMKRAHLVP